MNYWCAIWHGDESMALLVRHIKQLYDIQLTSRALKVATLKKFQEEENLEAKSHPLLHSNSGMNKKAGFCGTWRDRFTIRFSSDLFFEVGGALQKKKLTQWCGCMCVCASEMNLQSHCQDLRQKRQRKLPPQPGRAICNDWHVQAIINNKLMKQNKHPVLSEWTDWLSLSLTQILIKVLCSASASLKWVYPGHCHRGSLCDLDSCFLKASPDNSTS